MLITLYVTKRRWSGSPVGWISAANLQHLVWKLEKFVESNNCFFDVDPTFIIEALQSVELDYNSSEPQMIGVYGDHAFYIQMSLYSRY